MKSVFLALLAGALTQVALAGKPAPAAALTVREIHYAAQLADDEARLTVDLTAEATGESSLPLLAGDIAVLPTKLPAGLSLRRNQAAFQIVADRAGQYSCRLELVAKISRAEPWNQISFTGPAATIAYVTAQAAGTNTEVQLLTGTLLATFKTNGVSGVTGFLGAETSVALRWQGKVTEVARKVLFTVDSTITAQVTPTVIKYTSRFHYDIVQGSAAQLTLTLPAAQALTKLEGEQIRDWHTTSAGDAQTLTVEFIRPLEKAGELNLFSEQIVGTGATPAATELAPPQPLGAERESGSLTLFAEDTLVEIAALNGLRQVNAPENAVVAYRFNARPLALTLKLKPVEPVISLADRVNARVEETRLVIAHNLALDVQKAGIYSLELTTPAGFAVADVRGDGIEDWKADAGKVRVNFSTRVLGGRKLTVQLEQAWKNFPEKIIIAPLRAAGSAQETAEIGVAAAPGIRLKTAVLAGLREISANQLPNRTDETLAFTAGQPDWSATIASERMAARVVVEVFNLVTIGDGVVGGSATIRYSLANQGVQEFKVRVPANCKNVEFTGPNIRRKELAVAAAGTNDAVWTIGLQDKAWGGYTLVVTYDFPFDAKGASLTAAGIHALDVERETGSIALTTAASLQLDAKISDGTLHRVDETELSAADRSLVTRAVILAWQYTGDQYDLRVDVQRFATEPVLEAVADRTQITSVLTEAGEMLTQASFMVKNNEKQFQRFQLPADARLWGCYVNGQPAKPERDGDWVLVSLPRDWNRDQAFAVDIMYAQTNGALASTFGKTLELAAPRTDVPNTYAEWQVFAPPSLRLSDFGGSMSVTQGTTYELLDAWGKFLAFYGDVLREAGGAILFIGLLAFLVLALVVSAVRRGWNGVLTLLAVMGILVVLGAMLLPALSSAKKKAQSISSVNNLKQIGLAVRIFSGDNNDRLPVSFEEMKDELGTDKITYDPATGLRYTYLGGGLSLNQLKPDSVIAYSSLDERGRCEVLYADGSVEVLGAQRFAELSQRGLVQMTAPQELAEKQREVVVQNQLGGNKHTFTALPAGGNADGFAPAPAAAMTVNGTIASAAEPHFLAAPAAPVAAGIRSLRIELPQTGTPFLFTKVLNLHGEPLSIRATVIPLHTFQTCQMLWQSATFLLGLVLWWRQWRRLPRRSFLLTIALALIIGSVCSLLIQWRALHDALIIGFPVAVVASVALLVWKYWPRGNPAPAAASVPPPTNPLPPVIAAIALLIALGVKPVAVAETNTSALVAASYSGTVDDRVALLDVALDFASVTAGETFPLFGDDVAVQSFTAKTGRAELVRSGSKLAARFHQPGVATLQIKLLVKVTGDVTKRRLAFAIPSALAGRAGFTLAEAGADVDFPAAISCKRILANNGTRVAAVLGAADHLELVWTPRVKRTEEIAATVFCRNATLVTFGGGVMNLRATLDFQITQGELRQVRVQIPAGQKVLRVEGRDLRTWEIKEMNGVQMLVADLLKGVPLGWQLTVETEKNLAALPADAVVELPQALDVKRENGLIALRGADEIGLTVTTATGLERVDAEEFARIAAGKTDALASVFRFADPKFSLRVRAEAFQPEIAAMVKNNFRVGAEQLGLSAQVDYTIKRAGIFALKLVLPAGFRVERVLAGNLQQQAEHVAGDRRELEVTLNERVTGNYSLTIELARNYPDLPATISLVGVHPLGTAKLAGFVAVAAEAGVAVKTATFDGLTEIPAVTLPDYAVAAGAGNVLAYKFMVAAPTAAPGWQLRVTTEKISAWVRAETVNAFTLTETLVNGRAQLRYEIANAPVRELYVRVPAACRNVEFAGANIRSKEIVGNGTNDVLWRVALQSPVRGNYLLTVTWDAPRPATAGALELIGIASAGVERESGLLGIAAKPPLQASEATATNLQRVDTGDFPDWADAPDKATTLAYRYARPDYRLALAVRRFDDAAVLEALVDCAKFTSVVADDGQMMTEMALTVRNNGRQFLEIALPPDATVWSAFVAGQPVRPSLRAGKLLLPIESSGDADRALAVELTYVGTNIFPRASGLVAFASPKFDVPLKNARWEIYLPPDYDYQQFAGTMTRELAIVSEPASASFSRLDYSRMEQAGKETARTDWQRDVSEARRQLAGGNVRVATENFNRAKAKFAADKDANDAVKKLESDLKSAQASNLINAQNDFSVRNNGFLTEDRAGASGDLGPGYDAGVAQLQWAKLQQAQEIVTAKVQPLRVNLPVRGQHFAFTQVLQTEGGRPMTIQLLAASTKVVNWPAHLRSGLVAFLLLWSLVTLVVRLTRRPATA